MPMSTYRKPNMSRPPDQFDNCPVFLDNYLKYLTDFSQRRPATVIETFTALKEMLQYFHFISRFKNTPSTGDAHKDLDISAMPLDELVSLAEEDISSYISFLELKVLNSDPTIYKKLCAIRGFFAYLEQNAPDLDLPADYRSPAAFLRFRRYKESRLSVLSPEKTQKLISGCTGDTELRDRAIITLLATIPIQISDLVRLDRKDVDTASGFIRIRSGTRPAKRFPIPDNCSDAICDYLDWLDSKLAECDPPAKTPTALFTCKYGAYFNRITARAVQKRISKAAEVAGLGSENISAKILRDTATYHLLQSIQNPDKQKMLQMLDYLGYGNPSQIIRKFTSEIPEAHDPGEELFLSAMSNSPMSDVN